VPAERASWRPSAAAANSASLICERPALCRQTNRTRAIGLLAVSSGLVGLDALFGGPVTGASMNPAGEGQGAVHRPEV
jgi:hypothetical protein